MLVQARTATIKSKRSFHTTLTSPLSQTSPRSIPSVFSRLAACTTNTNQGHVWNCHSTTMARRHHLGLRHPTLDVPIRTRQRPAVLAARIILSRCTRHFQRASTQEKESPMTISSKDAMQKAAMCPVILTKSPEMAAAHAAMSNTFCGRQKSARF